MPIIYRTPDGDRLVEGPGDGLAEIAAPMSCWREIPELLDRLVAPPETLQVIREKVFATLDNLDDLVTCSGEVSATDGAHRVRVRYEPSPMLARLVATLRAGDLKTLIEHGARAPGAPDNGSVAAPQPAVIASIPGGRR